MNQFALPKGASHYPDEAAETEGTSLAHLRGLCDNLERRAEVAEDRCTQLLRRLRGARIAMINAEAALLGAQPNTALALTDLQENLSDLSNWYRYQGPACPTCGSDAPPLPGTGEYRARTPAVLALVAGYREELTGAAKALGLDPNALDGGRLFLAEEIQSMRRELAELRVIASAAIALADALGRDERTDEEQEEIVRVVDQWRRTSTATTKESK